MTKKRPFFNSRLALSICIGSSALDLQHPLSKFQRSVFLVKILHILPRVVQRPRPLHQVKVKKNKTNKQTNKQIKSINDVQQQTSFTLEAVPAEGHRSGR